VHSWGYPEISHSFTPRKGARVSWPCLSVCLSARIIRNAHGRTSSIFVHVAWGRGSVLLWQCCDMLCTSGFVDDIMFSHNDPGAFCVGLFLCGKHDNITAKTPTKYCSTIKTGSELRTRAKSSAYDCFVKSCSFNGRRADKQSPGLCLSARQFEKISGGPCSCTLRLLLLHTPSPFNPEHV